MGEILGAKNLEIEALEASLTEEHTLLEGLKWSCLASESEITRLNDALVAETEMRECLASSVEMKMREIEEHTRGSFYLTLALILTLIGGNTRGSFYLTLALILTLIGGNTRGSF